MGGLVNIVSKATAHHTRPQPNISVLVKPAVSYRRSDQHINESKSQIKETGATLKSVSNIGLSMLQSITFSTRKLESRTCVDQRNACIRATCTIKKKIQNICFVIPLNQHTNSACDVKNLATLTSYHRLKRKHHE